MSQIGVGWAIFYLFFMCLIFTDTTTWCSQFRIIQVALTFNYPRTIKRKGFSTLFTVGIEPGSLG